jgi:hypothetical protein
MKDIKMHIQEALGIPKRLKYKKSLAVCQWLMPVLPATQEAESRIAVQSQPRQTVPQDPIIKKPSQK